MAQEVVTRVALQLVFISGKDEHGEDAFSTKTFNRINERVAAGDLLAAAKGVASLQVFPLSEVNKVQANRLED